MVTEVTRHSWGSRLMDSLKNIVFGIVVFCLGIWLLWTNEHRAVRDYREINEVRNNVITVAADSISEVNEGAVVHVTGKAETSSVLKDPLFEVEANAIRLRRIVEMYQWQENVRAKTTKNTGGSSDTVTEYSYEKVWSERVIDSSEFKESGHENPKVMQPEGWADVAATVTLGSFTLGQDAKERLRFYESYTVHRATLPEGARLEDSEIRMGSTGSVPDIGDKRIRFEVVPQGTISIIAAQAGSDLKPWRSRRGEGYLRVQAGSHSSKAMLTQAESEINFRTWLFRLGGWLLMSFGMITALSPLAVLFDVLPVLGNLIGGGIKFFSLLSCGIFSLLIIGVAWVAARPLLGIPILVAAVWLMLWQWRRAVAHKAAVKDAKASKLKA